MSNNQKRLVIVGVSVVLILLCAGGSALSSYLARRFLVPSSTGTEVESPSASSLDYTDESGVLVAAVDQYSLAADAGIKRGDIILQVNGQPVNTVGSWLQLLAAFDEDDTIRMTALVDGKVEEYRIMMDARAPYTGLRVVDRSVSSVDNTSTTLLIPEIEATRTGTVTETEAQDLQPDARFAPAFRRPIVSGIIKDSPAADANLRIGDIITNVDDEAILTTDELVAAIGRYASGDSVEFTYRRGNQTLRVRVTLAQHPNYPDLGFLGVDLSGAPDARFDPPGLPDE